MFFFFIFFFREGRRASDGLVAQGILHSQSEYPLNSAVAFNSQRLHEVCKAKGVLELHLLQKEAAQLSTQYQASLPPDEMTVRQIQHTQFHVTPVHHANGANGCMDYANGAIYNQHHQSMDPSFYSCCGYAGKAGDLSTFVGLFKSEFVKIDSIRDYQKLEQLHQLQQSQMQKPPLQQQLMQHRLLQQKRQILQKQVAMETGLSRRQMLRQQSYKIAQQQQVLPPLPLNEVESEDLLAFQAIVEGPGGGAGGGQPSSAVHHHHQHHQLITNGGATPSGLMKTTHIRHQPPKMPPKQASAPAHFQISPDCWNALPVSLQTCHISDVTGDGAATGNWAHPTLYQVHNHNQR